MTRRLAVRMPYQPPEADGALFAGAKPRKLRLAVRRDGMVVFLLRQPSGAPAAAWELSSDDWLEVTARVERMLSDPERCAGAMIALGQERPVRREDELLRMGAPLVRAAAESPAHE